MSSTLRAVLVEDSLVQRAHLARVLQADGDIQVVGEAADAHEAARCAAEHRPDVVTMDLDLPGGGGKAAIERIMADSPAPILVLSGIIDDAHAQPAVEALAAGAVDAVPKPLRWTRAEEEDLRRRVREVAGVPVTTRHDRRGRARAAAGRPHSVIGVVASTGGPAALTALLRAMDGIEAPVLVVQHIHPAFVAGFVSWLASATSMRVELAEQGTEPQPATIYVAPGERHLVLGPDDRLHLQDEPASTHRPSGDVLLSSIAEAAGRRGIGIVLTGMGTDGAQGLLALRRAGGRTLAQDEGSCTVFGMPRAALDAGATDTLLPPQRLASAVLEAVAQAAG